MAGVGHGPPSRRKRAPEMGRLEPLARGRGRSISTGREWLHRVDSEHLPRQLLAVRSHRSAPPTMPVVAK
jgi:hypothetical protein